MPTRDPADGTSDIPTDDPSSATPEPAKLRRPLTPAERRQLEEKAEKAAESDPNIYPLW